MNMEDNKSETSDFIEERVIMQMNGRREGDVSPQWFEVVEKAKKYGSTKLLTPLIAMQEELVSSTQQRADEILSRGDGSFLPACYADWIFLSKCALLIKVREVILCIVAPGRQKEQVKSSRSSRVD